MVIAFHDTAGVPNVGSIYRIGSAPSRRNISLRANENSMLNARIKMRNTLPRAAPSIAQERASRLTERGDEPAGDLMPGLTSFNPATGHMLPTWPLRPSSRSAIASQQARPTAVSSVYRTSGRPGALIFLQILAERPVSIYRAAISAYPARCPESTRRPRIVSVIPIFAAMQYGLFAKNNKNSALSRYHRVIDEARVLACPALGMADGASEDKLFRLRNSG